MSNSFRHLKPVELWSARMEVGLPVDVFSALIGSLSCLRNETFSGFVTGDDDVIHSFTRTRYPRAKYGIPKIDRLEQTTALLAAGMMTDMQLDPPFDGFRVVLGLVEGYPAEGETEVTHDISEVHQALGGTSIQITPARVFAAHPAGPQPPKPGEACAVATGSLEELDHLYWLSCQFRQQRFTVENFVDWQAFLVETPYCTTPDPA